MCTSPAKTYQEAFGKEMEANSLLRKLPEDLTAQEEERLGTDLLQCRDVVSAHVYRHPLGELSQQHHQHQLHQCVVVIIVSAAAVLALCGAVQPDQHQHRRAASRRSPPSRCWASTTGKSAPTSCARTVPCTIIGALFGLVGGIAPAPVCHLHRRGGRGHVRPDHRLVQLCLCAG